MMLHRPLDIGTATALDMGTGNGFNHRLDLVRGIAALCVTLHHAEAHFGTGRLFSHAYLAVDFFFLLSGYVLGRAYDRKFANGLSGPGYLRMRIVRLWPVMAIGILLGALSALARGVAPEPVLALLLTQLCFIPFLASSGAMFVLNGVQWSLWFELLANGLQALLLRRLDGRGLALLLILFGGALLATSLHFGQSAFGDTGANWWGGFARVGFSFTLGYALSRETWRARRPWLNILSTAPFRADLLASLGLLIVLIGAGLAARYSDLMTGLAAVFLILPLLLLIAISSPPGTGESGRTTFLGAISFPLYAVHIPLIEFAAPRVAMESAPIRLAVAAVTVIAGIALATLLHHWIERPLIGRSRRLRA